MALRLLAATALAALTFSVGPSHAFRDMAYYSGMSLDEAKEQGRISGTPLLATQEDPDSYYVGAQTKARTVLSFCHEKLYAIRHRLLGNVISFAENLHRMAAEYGSPIIESASAREGDVMTAEVAMTWLTDGEEVSVWLTSATSTADFVEEAMAMMAYNASTSICGVDKRTTRFPIYDLSVPKGN